MTDGVKSDLDRRIAKAHGRQDHLALVALYSEAAERMKRAGNSDAEAFLLTYAYVYALESDTTETPQIHARLVELGRDK